MPEAVILCLVVSTEEVVELANDVVRLVALEPIVVIRREISAKRIDGPRQHLTGVLQVAVARNRHHQVFLREGRRSHPVVVGLSQRRRVVPKRLGLEIGLVRRQTHLDPPVCARREIHRSHDHAHASVFVLTRRVVDRSCRRRRVSDHAEVEFDATRGPRPPQRDIPELHHLVSIDELVAGFLHDGAPDLASHVREDKNLDVLILEDHDPPVLRFRVLRVPVDAVVGVQARVLDQDRNRVGIRERVRLERARLLGNARLRGRILRGREQAQCRKRDKKSLVRGHMGHGSRRSGRGRTIPTRTAPYRSALPGVNSCGAEVPTSDAIPARPQP